MTYSTDFRASAVNYYQHNQNTSYEEAGLIFGVGASTLCRWVRQFEQTQSLEARASPGRRPILQTQHLESFKEFLHQHPDKSCEALAEMWHEFSGIKFSNDTVRRNRHRLGFSYKKNFSGFGARQRKISETKNRVF
jgi:transposase